MAVVVDAPNEFHRTPRTLIITSAQPTRVPVYHIIPPAGPVGPSDMVGGTNSTLLMSTCRPGDGLLLRPDKAAVTVDSAFQYGVWGALSSQGQDIMCPDVLVTYSAHHDHGTTAGPSGSTFWKWYYLLNVRLGTDFVMPWSDLGLSAAEIGQATSYTAVEWFNIGASE